MIAFAPLPERGGAAPRSRPAVENAARTNHAVDGPPGTSIAAAPDDTSGVRLLAFALVAIAGTLWITIAPTPSAPSPPAVGSPVAPGAVATAPLSVRIAVNSATAEELAALPGVGPNLAQRIVDDRAGRGGFATAEELDRVPGIGPALVERVRPFVRVD